jgi:protein O-mannosyl-transferase
MGPKSKGWLRTALLVIATFAAYLPAWNGTPIWDDDAHLTRPELRSLEGLTRIWVEPGATQQYYPLIHSLFWLEHHLWGDWPAGYHWLNIMLHCASALLLVRILQTLEIPGAWLAGAIFALHPIQAESVAWISELKNTLSGAFYFGSMLAYLKFDRTRNWASYFAALMLFLLGLLSKTAIATLPGAILVIFWWKRGKLSLKKDLLPLIPFFLLGTAAGLMTAGLEQSLIGAKGSEYHYSMVERILIAGRVIWFYLGKLFWPLDLTFIYPRWQISQNIWWQYLFPASVLVLLAVLAWLGRRSRAPLAGLLFFVGTLFPVLGFMNVFPFRYSLVADHFQYLASVGMITLAAAGITLFFERRLIPQWPVGYFLSGTLLACLTVLTWRQNTMYSDIETLWRTTIEKNPSAWMAHNNLGALLLKQGKADEAILHFQKTLELKPDEVSAEANLGNAQLQKGQFDEAIADYSEALQMKPDDAEVHYNLGNALLHQGRLDEAVVHYQKAIELNPNYPDAHNNLGILLFQQGKLDQAIAQYQKALELNPKDIQARANLAWALATSVQTPILQAIGVKLAEQANQLTGGTSPTVLHILAAAYAQTGRFSAAIETAERSLQLAIAQNNSALVEALRTEISLYEKGLPYRSVK